MSRRITIVFFDAGGGHRNAAEALKSQLESQQQPWQVELLDLQNLLDRLDVLRKLTGLRMQDGYNLLLKKGWTRFTPQMLVVLHVVVRMHHKPVVKMLREQWEQHPTDMVLSVIPHFNRALAESLEGSETAFGTLLTDLADYPPHYWIEQQQQFLICGTEFAENQALQMGHDRKNVFLASGMVMKPKFYQKLSVNREEERKRLGLEVDIPTGIIMFGGYGSKAILNIVKRLNASSSRVQLIVICGKNQKLLAAVKQMRARFPIFVEGFTQNVDHYMAVSDFFVGKPGPGSISEALQFHLPVIVERNGRTLPAERYNAQWLTEKRLGIVLKSFRKIDEGVEKLLDPPTFSELRTNAAHYNNRALLEIPEFLEEIVQRHERVQA